MSKVQVMTWCGVEEWTWWIWASQLNYISTCNHNQLATFYTSGYYAPLASMPKASKLQHHISPLWRLPLRQRSPWLGRWRRSLHHPILQFQVKGLQLILKYLHILTVWLLMVIEVEHSVTHHPSTITYLPIQLHHLLYPILFTQRLVLAIKINTLGSYMILMQSKDVPRRRWWKYAI